VMMTKKKLGASVRDHHDREFAIQRALKSAQRQKERSATFFERAKDEKDNYAKFSNFMRENKEAWVAFYKDAKKSYDDISSLTHQNF